MPESTGELNNGGNLCGLAQQSHWEGLKFFIES